MRRLHRSWHLRHDAPPHDKPADDALAEAGYQIPSSRILVMGCAYLEDSDDTRNASGAIGYNHPKVFKLFRLFYIDASFIPGTSINIGEDNKT